MLVFSFCVEIFSNWVSHIYGIWYITGRDIYRISYTILSICFGIDRWHPRIRSRNFYWSVRIFLFLNLEYLILKNILRHFGKIKWKIRLNSNLRIFDYKKNSNLSIKSSIRSVYNLEKIFNTSSQRLDSH